MKVRLLTRMAGPCFNAGPGEEVEVSAAVAEQLVQGGYAVPLQRAAPELPKSQQIPQPAPEIETAEAPAAPEKAVRRPRRK